MVRNEPPGPEGADQSLGDLVALAAKDVSQLMRYEIDLAKTELRADLKRIGLAGAMGGFSGCGRVHLLHAPSPAPARSWPRWWQGSPT